MTQITMNISAEAKAAREPWLWKLTHDFGVKINILKANVDTDFGWFQIRLEGTVEDIQRATAWLMTTGMHVETDDRALGTS